MRQEPLEAGEPLPLDVDLLYRQEASRLVGMLTAYVGDRAEAEDLAQEAFARVHRAWDRIDDPGRAVSYLRATAFNLARSGFRRRRRRPRPERLDVGPSAEEGFALREDQREVWRALDALPERQRACIVLRYYADEGIDEIAATLGIGRNSVKTHLTRGLASLGRRLEPPR